MKRLFFVGSAREDLASFPDAARRAAGYALFMVQAGRHPADFKPLPDVGRGACEIRVRDETGAFRVIYVAKFKDAARLPEEDSNDVANGYRPRQPALSDDWT